VRTDEIASLIRYHEEGLNQYRQHMGPSSQYLEEQTVKALRELHVRIVAEEEASRSVQVAKDILSSTKQ